MQTSRLSKNLVEVFKDKNATSYLLQFMSSQNARHLVQFWLDAESFRATAVSRLSTLSRINSIPGRTGSVADSDLSCQKVHEECSHSCTERLTDNLNRVADVANLNDNNIVPCSRLDENTVNCNANLCAFKNASDMPYVLSAQQLNSKGANQNDTVCQCVNIPGCLSVNNQLQSKCVTCSVCTVSKCKSYSVNGGTDYKLESDAGNCFNQSGSHSYVDGQSKTSNFPHQMFNDEADFKTKLLKSIENDAVLIFSRYIALDATQPVGVTDQLRNETISRICHEDRRVDTDCFIPCQRFVFDLINKKYFEKFKESVFYLRHQADILTRYDVTLMDILYNQSSLFYFTEFMEQEGARHLLQCWSDLESFRQLLQSQQHKQTTVSAVQNQEDAVIIYDRYFSLQALNPLGFPNAVRQEIESNICAEDGPQENCFHTAYCLLLQRLDKNYFAQFLKSDVYLRLLSDLVTSVQSLLASPTPSFHKRSDDDTASLHSSSSVGDGTASAASLISGSDKQLRRSTARVNDDMRIDDNLLRPDNLWKRSNVGLLSLGRMDKLGRYISEVDPEPDTDKKKKGPFFKMNLFKDAAPEKDEEEMAAQIADMIIRDITQMTMSHQ